MSTNFNDRWNLLTVMLLTVLGFWGDGGMLLGHIDPLTTISTAAIGSIGY